MSRRLLPLLVAAACMISAGCSGSGEGDRGSSGFGAALASVPAAAPASRSVAYVDMARLRADKIVNTSAGSGERVAFGWELVATLAGEPLYRQAAALRDAVGVDLFGVDDAVSIGRSSKAALYDFTGHFDAAAITRKLTRLGAERHRFGSSDGLSSPSRIMRNKLAAQQIYEGESLSNVIVSADEFAASGDPATLAARTGAGKSLEDTGSYAAVADCLGDVVAAYMVTPAADPNAQVVAAGVRDPGSPTKPLHEVLCVAPAQGRAAAVRTALNRAFGPGATDPLTGDPVSASVGSAQVSESGGIVHADLAMHSPVAGYLISSLLRGKAGYWVGDCPASRAAEGRC